MVAYTKNPIDGLDVLLPCKLAAAICYNSKPSATVLKSCYASGHGSVLEHVSFTFHVSEISRSCSHQIVRHRLASYDQRSQRYCDEDGFGYYTPPSAGSEYDTCMKTIEKMYIELKKTGLHKEDAREVLPNACHTQMYITMNLRELAHFMNLRLCTRAQAQIREVAQLMRQEVLDVCPEAEYMLVPKCKAIPGMSFCTEHESCGISPKLKDIFERAAAYDGLCK